MKQVISERRRVSSVERVWKECVNQQQHRRWDIMAVRWAKERTRGRSRRSFTTRRPGMTWREETALVHFHREYSRKEIYHESVSSSCAVDPLLRHRWVEFLSTYAPRLDYAFLDHFRAEISPICATYSFEFFSFFLFFFFFLFFSTYNRRTEQRRSRWKITIEDTLPIIWSYI